MINDIYINNLDKLILISYIIMYTSKKGGMIMKLSNKRMSGFTLAEVLITLGIIGVVAAMTMPTLMNSTQGAQYKAAYKKALSAIAQGLH